MDGKIATIIIAAIISSDVAVFLLQNFIFGKRIKKLERKLEQDKETFRYKFHKQQSVENALDAVGEVARLNGSWAARGRRAYARRYRMQALSDAPPTSPTVSH